MMRLQRTVATLSTWAAYAAGLVMFGMVIIIMVEITLRTFFNQSTFIMDEFVGYGLAAMTFLGLGYTLRENGLIRMKLLITLLSGAARRVLEVFCVITTLALAVYMTAYFWRSVARNWERESVSASIAEVPLWMPEALLLLGLILFVVQLAAYLASILVAENPRYLDADEEAVGGED